MLCRIYAGPGAGVELARSPRSRVSPGQECCLIRRRYRRLGCPVAGPGDPALSGTLSAVTVAVALAGLRLRLGRILTYPPRRTGLTVTSRP